MLAIVVYMMELFVLSHSESMDYRNPVLEILLLKNLNGFQCCLVACPVIQDFEFNYGSEN